MEYVFNPDIDTIVVESVYRTLSIHLLNGEKVLWVISGGSAIMTAVKIAEKLHGRDLSRLSVTLIDERYGPIGHENENWQQLLDAGFKMKKAILYRPLIGKSRSETAQAYALWIQEHMTDAKYRIGLFGMGKDGHTAGILPRSAASSASGWIANYDGPDFERLTLTFDAIRHLDEAVLQVKGSDKAVQVRRLRDETINLALQPAQVLKQIKKSTLFTDIRESV